MRLSKFFMPILRDNPKEAEILSHRLMLRAGMIRQEAAGIYSWLPLGYRVLKKIEQIVREELDRAGCVEMLMPTLQLADLWRESGRYDAYGPEMLRIQDRNKREMLYGPTNEEMITAIFRSGVKSYRELPKNLYHFQWKFRDEQRPRFGVMRGREFLMKDAYSFDVDEAAARRSYRKYFVAYLRIFARMGLTGIPMRAETGPIGGDLSHEFIVLAATGESGVFVNKDVLSLPIPPADIDYDGDLTPIVEQWTESLRRHRGCSRSGPLRGRDARGQAGRHTRHRGRSGVLFRRQVHEADEGHDHRCGRHRSPCAMRLLRRRRVAPGRRHHRGLA